MVEKAAEIGGHILSGAVMDPVGLTELIPDWREQGAPVGPSVTDDRFHVLGRRHDFVLPNWLLPPLMRTASVAEAEGGPVDDIGATERSEGFPEAAE